VGVHIGEERLGAAYIGLRERAPPGEVVQPEVPELARLGLHPDLQLAQGIEVLQHAE